MIQRKKIHLKDVKGCGVCVFVCVEKEITNLIHHKELY
jgi:Pyruvate/2-oxoacid:ferredoxin oxidoreductase delta subunit